MATRQPTEESPTRTKVKAMVRAGVKPSEIAFALRLSPEAVYKHIRRLRADGELPEPNEEAS